MTTAALLYLALGVLVGAVRTLRYRTYYWRRRGAGVLVVVARASLVWPLEIVNWTRRWAPHEEAD